MKAIRARSVGQGRLVPPGSRRPKNAGGGSRRSNIASPHPLGFVPTRGRERSNCGGTPRRNNLHGEAAGLSTKSWRVVPVLSLLFPLLAAAPAYAAKNLRIESISFDTHFNPGDLITFAVTVRNRELTTEFAEVDISITSQATGKELTLNPVLTANIAAGGKNDFSTTHSSRDTDPPNQSGASAVVPRGSYTVAFTLFDGDGARSDQVRGKFPLHVGTEAESIRAFPEVLDLGTLPPGRTMHPIPIEITWDFFRFNRLLQDQPFAIRIYTDNAARFHGVSRAIRKSSAAGLVSLDGRYTLPLKVWTINFGPDIQETGWDGPLAGPPPVDDDDFWIGPPLLEGYRSLGSAMWVRIPDLIEMTANPITWRRLIGQDQSDDRFAVDSNPTGDFTLKSPFTFYLATDAGATTPVGSYSATLIVELWTP